MGLEGDKTSKEFGNHFIVAIGWYKFNFRKTTYERKMGKLKGISTPFTGKLMGGFSLEYGRKAFNSSEEWRLVSTLPHVNNRQWLLLIMHMVKKCFQINREYDGR